MVIKGQHTVAAPKKLIRCEFIIDQNAIKQQKLLAIST